MSLYVSMNAIFKLKRSKSKGMQEKRITHAVRIENSIPRDHCKNIDPRDGIAILSTHNPHICVPKLQNLFSFY